MPTYKDLYDALTEALDKIQNTLDDVRLQCEEIRYWGIKGADGEKDIPPLFLSEEHENSEQTKGSP